MSTTQPTPALTPDQIRAQIERTRAELAETVDALAAKADVKAQAKDKVHEVTDSVKEKATDIAGTVKEKATGIVGTLREKATELTGRAADAVPHPGHPGHDATTRVPVSADDRTVVLTDTVASDDTTVLGASKHRAPGGPVLDPIGTDVDGDGAPGPVSQAKEKVTAVAGSVAAAASSAAADVKARVTGATGHGGADATGPGGNAVAPGEKRVTLTAGPIAVVLAVLAVVVIVRKRRAARA